MERIDATCCSAVGSKVVDGPSLNDAAQFVVGEEGVDCALAEALARLVRDSSRNGQKPELAQQLRGWRAVTLQAWGLAGQFFVLYDHTYVF